MRHTVSACVIAALLWCAAALPGVDVPSAARHIDELIAADLARHGQHANPDSSDPQFIRRVYLDIIGRIPTYDELSHALADHSSDRRHQLIEHLLGSEGYLCAQYIFWADLLRLQSSLMGRYPGDPYIDWVKQAIRSDMPYDQFVTALITASGPLLAEGNGSTGYYVRDAGMPQDNMSNTVQVFLGTRLACAQCHNHPFDHWTRLNYMQMVAYTNGTKSETDPALVAALKRIADAQGGASKDEKEAMRKYADAIGGRISDAAKDSIALPKDFQYPEGKPNQSVKAHPIFGDLVLAKGEPPRQAYARWLTAPENPRFTEVIANRLWKRCLGIGLIEPVDNITDQTQASNPELMEYLTGLMKDCGYDLKRFQEIIYHTRTYQAQCTRVAVPDPTQYHCPGPLLRRMRAEQVWDSLLTLIIPDLDQRHASDVASLYAYYQQMVQKTPEEIWGMVKQLADKLQSRRELGDAMRLKEDQATDHDAWHKSSEFQALRQQQQSLDNAIRDLSFDRRTSPQAPDDDPRWKGIRRDFVRASELPSPAPPGHFLRDFGASDRMLIENANDHAAVTQALTLLNGFVDQNVFQPKSVLMRNIASCPEREGKLRTVYLSILGRPPGRADEAIFGGWLTPADPAQNPSAGSSPTGSPPAASRPPSAAALEARQTDALVRSVAWTLINSHEFLFVQ